MQSGFDFLGTYLIQLALMLKKRLILLIITLAITLFFNSPVFAFSNLEELKLKIKDQEKIIHKDEFNKWTKYNPTLEHQKNYKSKIENISHCDTTLILCSLLSRTVDGFHTKKIQQSSPDEEIIVSFLENLSEEINIEPVNASFSIKEGQAAAFSIEKDGMGIDLEKSKEKIMTLIQNQDFDRNEIELPYEILSPEIKSSDVNKMGIVELIGEGRSNFSGSTNNRIFNIQVASNKFNGLIIKPGEEFSFVEHLGPVDGENGYKQELVIKKNKTELDYGGGVCQVSTTVFRAAIYSGLEITARRNHAYPVHYYDPQGMDSTVYVPKPDLKFINNTGNHILIQYEINIPARELVFRFYGTKNGRRVDVDGPHITSRESDGSMETVFTQTVYDSNNITILSDVFKSSYDSPNNYPQPGQEVVLTEKPKNWSNGEWKDYKKAHGV